MPGDNRRTEHRICCDPNHQEDRDDDRRNEIFHGHFHAKENGIAGVAGDRSQHAGEHCRRKGKTGEQDHRLKIFLALRIGLLSTWRRRPLVFWQKLNQ